MTTNENVVAMTETKANRELENLVKEAALLATSEDHATLKDLTEYKGEPKVVLVTPGLAALLLLGHNGFNRKLSASRAREYAGAMDRGEWELTHQGIALSEDSQIGDGQHRSLAVVISGKPQKFWFFFNFKKQLVDVIDIGGVRNSGDAIELAGIQDARLKANVAKSVMSYESELETGRISRFTVRQVENFVKANDDQLTDAILICKEIVEKCSEPVLSVADSATAALLLARGGYHRNMVSGYIGNIQLGVSNYPEAPTTDLSRQFMRARISDKRKDTLNKKTKLALLCKGAELFILNKSVSRVTWKPSKESLPRTNPPVVNDIAAE
jgi:hypothetical protein